MAANSKEENLTIITTSFMLCMYR